MDLFDPPAPPRPVPTIAHVYRTDSGKVVVFDEKNQEMPEYSGRWDEKREMIMRDMPHNVRIR